MHHAWAAGGSVERDSAFRAAAEVADGNTRHSTSTAARRPLHWRVGSSCSPEQMRACRMQAASQHATTSACVRYSQPAHISALPAQTQEGVYATLPALSTSRLSATGAPIHARNTQRAPLAQLTVWQRVDERPLSWECCDTRWWCVGHIPVHSSHTYMHPATPRIAFKRSPRKATKCGESASSRAASSRRCWDRSRCSTQQHDLCACNNHRVDTLGVWSATCKHTLQQ